MRERKRVRLTGWAMVVAMCVGIGAAPGDAQDDGEWGHVVLTEQIVDAWIDSFRDPRVAAVFGDSRPDAEDEDAELSDLVIGLKALADDEDLGGLVRLYGFTGARDWVDATLKMNSGIFCGVTITMAEERGAPPEGEESEAYKAYREEIDKELRSIRELWGEISDAEQAVVIEALENVRMMMMRAGPIGVPTLKLEGLQRWIACDRDARIGAVLDEIGDSLEEGPAALKRLILTASVRPEIDAAVSGQGFGGGHEWADVTMRVVAAALETGINMKLSALDEEAAEHTPEEYQELVDRQYQALGDVYLSFGARPDEDMGLVGKYREAVFKALGTEQPEGEQT